MQLLVKKSTRDWVYSYNFRGILFGKHDSFFPGCAYSFTLFLNQNNLSDPPYIVFDKPLDHPLIYTHHLNRFCFPIDDNNPVSCSSPIDEIMNKLYDLIFLRKKTRSQQLNNLFKTEYNEDKKDDKTEKTKNLYKNFYNSQSKDLAKRILPNYQKTGKLDATPSEEVNERLSLFI